MPDATLRPILVIAIAVMLLPPTYGTLLLVIAIALVLLPPKYDPAIRLKEWLENRRRE